MNDIFYITQYLKDIRFTDNEINELYSIVHDSVEKSKDIESEFAYMNNYKYLDGYRQISDIFGGDWYYYVKTLLLDFRSRSYYISNSGDDNNDGLSPTTPISTLSKLNSLNLNPYDKVYLNRGDEWRENIVVQSNKIIYDVYGTGDLPIINGADILDSDWTEYSTNVWVHNCPAISAYKGIGYSYACVVDDTKQEQVIDLVSVSGVGKYFIERDTTNKIYLYSTINPGTLVTEVSARFSGILVEDKRNIQIKNIECRNFGHSGVYFYRLSTTTQFMSNSIVDGCKFYGNRSVGIEMFNGFSGVLVQNCISTYNGNNYYAAASDANGVGSNYNIFRNCYSGYSIQHPIGFDVITDGHGIAIYDSNNCIIEYCESEGDDSGIATASNNRAYNLIVRYNYVHDTKLEGTGIGIGGNIAVGGLHEAYGNIVENIGAGDETYAISCGGSRYGTLHIYNNVIYLDGDPSHTGYCIVAGDGNNMTVKNNIFVSKATTTKLMYIGGTSGFVSNNNVFYSPNDEFNLFQIYGDTYHTLTTLQIGKSLDLNSIQTNPLFVSDGSDYHLDINSTVVGIGTNVGILKDYDGITFLDLPSPGVYQYIRNPLAPNGDPSNLSLSVVSDTEIDLTWVNNCTNEDIISIESSTDGVTYSEIDTVLAGVTTYSAIELIGRTLYYFRVRALKGAVYSAYSNVSTATTQSSWIPEYDAVLDAMSVEPSLADQTIQNTWLKGMVDGGYFAKAELLDLFSVDNSGNSLLNWKSPGTFNPSKSGSPAWEAYKGYTGSSGNFIKNNFIPSTNGTLIGQDNICTIIGLGTDLSDNKPDFGVRDGSTVSLLLWANYPAYGLITRCNSTSEQYLTNTNSIKHYTMSRNNSTNYDRYVNLSKVNLTSASTGLPSKELYTCALNDNGSASSGSRQVRYVFVFSYLTEAEVTGVINLTEAYLDNYGAGLIA